MKATTRASGWAALCLATAIAAISSGVSFAQDPHAVTPAAGNPLIEIGKQIWVGGANCRDCHGNMGNGVADDPRSPNGANLRVTTLDAKGLSEVILCGRPGTPMPHYDRRAYTDDRCYGVTAEDLGDQTPRPGAPMTKRQADALSQFILANFVGAGDPTFEQCTALFGEAATSCPAYPKGGEAGH